jgi:hypothetical protein
MWAEHQINIAGLFPFVPVNVAYVDSVGGFLNSPPFSDYWLFSEEEEARQVGTPVGPETGFPLILTKEQLAWFVYKAKTWQVTASGSYDYTVEERINQIDTEVQYEGEFAFDFVLGRNIGIDGEVLENEPEGQGFAGQYFPNEKSLLRTIGRGTIPTLAPRTQSVVFTQTRTEYPPEEAPVVSTSEESAVLKISVFANFGIQEPFNYPPYAWTPSAEPIYDYGSWSRPDSLIACNLIVDVIAPPGSASSNALQSTSASYFFPNEAEFVTNALIEVPWSEEPLAVPLHRSSGEANRLALSEINLSPLSFWEYQPTEL